MSSKIEADESPEIDCLGVDGKLHVCLPWEDQTKCQIKVRKKEVTGHDRITKFSCYECTY